MTDESKITNNELARLKREYLEIEAPPYLAARIGARAAAAGERRTSRYSLLAAAGAMALIVALVLPSFMARQPAPTPTSALPSLSALTPRMPMKPTGVSPSLAGLESLTRPGLPAKPAMPRRTQAHIDDETTGHNEPLKEKADEYS